MIRYTKRLKTKDGRSVTLKIFTDSHAKFVWHFVRAWYTFGTGNSYEFDDTQL